MKKRFLAFALTLGLIMSLTACGGKAPEASELLAGGLPEDAKSWTMAIGLKLSADVDVGDMFGSDDDLLDDTAEDGDMNITDGSELSGATTMHMGVDISATAELDNGLSHVSGKSLIELFGMTSEIPMEVWAEVKDGKTTSWSYSMEDGGWEKTEDAGETDTDALANLMGVDGLELTDAVVSEEGACWVVTGKTKSSKLTSLGVDELMSSMVDPDTNTGGDFDIDAKLYYDKSSKQLSKIEMTCDSKVFTEFNLTMELSKVNETSLAIPDEVRNAD